MENELPRWDNIKDSDFYNYFRETLENCKKVLCLPHKTIELKEILLLISDREKRFGRGEYMKKVVDYVDYAISHKL